jgi:prepilin-type N-terminal cleavage/methylation domain-containing protein
MIGRTIVKTTCLAGIAKGLRHARILARDVRAFSLIELLVAMSLAAIVLTAAMTAVTHANKAATVGREERELVREAEFLSVILQQAIERAGTGVPANTHLDDLAPNPPRAVVFAGADVFGVLGDFPRPHAQYSTIGYLHSRPGGNTTRLNYHTENNGSCVPNTAPPTCDIAETSFFFPGDTTPCEAAGEFYNRTCAWGLRRLAPGDHIQIVAGVGGSWTTGVVHGTAASAIETAPVASSPHTVPFLKLAAGYADSGVTWPNATSSDAPVGTPGHAFVTTLDRLFIRYDSGNRRLERRQCWGNPRTDAAWWPPEAAGALPATLDDTGSGRWCTPWEIILRDVSAAAFSYFDSAGVATAVKEDMRRIDYTIEVERNILGATVRYFVTGSAAVAKGAT